MGAMLISLLLGTLMTLAMNPPVSVASTEQQQLVDKARLTIEAFAKDPQQQDVRQWLSKAKGVFVVPQLLRGAFVFGGTGGSGVFLVRDEKS